MKISVNAWHQIVNRVQTNEYTDTHLDLSGLGLNSVNIKQLVTALAANHHITSLDLSHNKLGDLGVKALAANTTLTSLDISDNLIGVPNFKAIESDQALIDLGLEPIYTLQLPGIEALASNTTLTHLNISNNSLGVKGAQILSTNTHLHSLDISHNAINAESAHDLANHPTLTSLIVSGFEIGQAGLEALTTPNSTLIDLDDGARAISIDTWHKILIAIETNQYNDSELDLAGFNLNDLDIRQLSHALESNHSITTLNLENNNISTLGELVHNAKLISLNVAENHLGSLDAQILAKNTVITHLNMNHNDIGETGAIALANNTILSHLEVGNNHIGIAGLTALAANTTLMHLNVNNNQLGTEGASILANNTKLISLNIGSNHIGDLGATALATNTTLTCLDVDNNDIHDQGASAIAHNSTLTDLNIGHNYLDVSLIEFGKNSTLSHLNLSANNDLYNTNTLKYIGDMTGLTHLDLSYNFSLSIHYELFNKLADSSILTQLNLSHTDARIIHSASITHLEFTPKYGYIADSKLKHLLKEIPNLSHLTLGKDTWINYISPFMIENDTFYMISYHQNELMSTLDSNTTLKYLCIGDVGFQRGMEPHTIFEWIKAHPEITIRDHSLPIPQELASHNDNLPISEINSCSDDPQVDFHHESMYTLENVNSSSDDTSMVLNDAMINNHILDINFAHEISIDSTTELHIGDDASDMAMTVLPNADVLSHEDELSMLLDTSVCDTAPTLSIDLSGPVTDAPEIIECCWPQSVLTPLDISSESVHNYALG